MVYFYLLRKEYPSSLKTASSNLFLLTPQVDVLFLGTEGSVSSFCLRCDDDTAVGTTVHESVKGMENNSKGEPSEILY
jgi:hypothetical protein